MSGKAGDSFSLARSMAVSVLLLLASAGCSHACEIEAKKHFAATKKAMNGLFGEESATSYSEVSGCDSGDRPSLAVWLPEDSRSTVAIFEKMKAADWKPLSEKETAPYHADFVLDKNIDGRSLVAAIRNAPQGGGKMVEVFMGD